MKTKLIFFTILLMAHAKGEISLFEKMQLDLAARLDSPSYSIGCHPVNHTLTKKTFIEGDFVGHLNSLFSITMFEDGNISFQPKDNTNEHFQIHMMLTRPKLTNISFMWNSELGRLSRVDQNIPVTDNQITFEKGQLLHFSVHGNTIWDTASYIIKYDESAEKWSATGYKYKFSSENGNNTAELTVFNGSDYQTNSKE